MVQWNCLLIAFLAVFAAGSLSRWFLTQINVRHLRRHGHEVPAVFQGEIDEEILSRMSNYTADHSKFGSLEHFFDDTVTLVILLSGFLPWLSGVIASQNLHFITSGLIFLGILALISGTLNIPFSLYRTFVIEKKYGFSTITLALWMTDLIKSLLISTILMGMLLSALLALMHYAQMTWWFWTWLVFSTFQVLMVWLYPVLIAPLFNKFEPVKNEPLKDAIISLMEKVGLKTEGVYQVDAGKRSRHTNAYFTGLGKTKRIVLYDTLLASHTSDEILSVLAHEIGHWKRKHIVMQLAFMEIVSLGMLYIMYRLTDWPLLYYTFGFQENIPYIGLLLLAALFGPIAFFLTPFSAAVMRKFERQADDDCLALIGTAQPMITALKRLARDNLANLHPHPFFAWFYYSHPPLAERITRISNLEKQAQQS
ncbi:MAG: M48 family metallopeptidase [Deltaproteobacteria bacterium]|nr:M48 family metallopeptidase [Deltaproteobacteria bacterium]